MPKVFAERSDVIPALGEIFREYGFAGASLSEITERTGLGKGSLYHFFPNGKNEMAEAVLNEIDTWFNENVFAPLRESEDAVSSIRLMFNEVNRYFKSGKRICLVGAFALDHTRDHFSEKVCNYFKIWMNSLTTALKRNGLAKKDAKEIAEEVVGGIQGALVLARSQDDPKIFVRAMKRLEKRIMELIGE